MKGKNKIWIISISSHRCSSDQCNHSIPPLPSPPLFSPLFSTLSFCVELVLYVSRSIHSYSKCHLYFFLITSIIQISYFTFCCHIMNLFVNHPQTDWLMDSFTSTLTHSIISYSQSRYPLSPLNNQIAQTMYIIFNI